MKRKCSLLLCAVLIFCILSACSGVSKEDYQTLQNENAQLQQEKDALQEQINSMQDEKVVLQVTLANTYDAYRYMMLFVTTEVYGNSLSKAEWEKYITNPEHPVPTFEEIKELVN